MTLPKVDFETKETILESIEQVANEIANNVVLKVNDAYYRIVDFEFYTYTRSEVFQDPHTYKNKLQLQNNRLYLHYSGVDITFGDDENYGGILLRGVIKFYKNEKCEQEFDKQQFERPQVVSMELFSNLHSLDNKEKNEITLVNANENLPAVDFPAAIKIIKTKRVGLTAKLSDVKEFHNELLRYIVVLPVFSNFKYKTEGIERLIGECLKTGDVKPEEAEKILGYKRNFS